MKKERTYQLLLPILLLFIFISSCSTKKNTWSRRNYQALTTHFNINFHGKQSYQEGINNIRLAQQDDYSALIPLFPISNHANASAATGQMDITIEKGRKAIKTHSIKKKPKKNLKKAANPSYKDFYDQKEFNPALKEAWLLLAKAEFHKADFLGAIGSFSYIAKLYSGDKDILIQSQLWMARAYTELDWLYEAEQMLSNINQNELKQSEVGLFAAATACLQLKKGQYKETIPFVELYLSREKDKAQKIRASYLLAQLHQNWGDKQLASKSYANVIKKNPPYEMRLNAQLNLTELKSETNSEAALTELQKMAKKRNNKDYLDQIYYISGKIYIEKKDSLKAIEYYELAKESSTRNGIDKANALTSLADIFYEKKEFKKAQLAYSEATRIVPTEYPNYKSILKKSEVLEELNTQQEIVLLQDSLLHLSTLPESEQRRIAEQIIADLQKQEEKTREKEQEANNEDYDYTNDEYERPNVVPNRMSSGKWYFYNPSTVSSGKTAFKKSWGNRKLEDNWRRSNKAGVLFAESLSTSESPSETDTPVTAQNREKEQGSNDNKSPEFYLQQIPKSAEQIENSKLQIANALLTMGDIFKDKMSDFEMATNCYTSFIRRFGNDKRVPEVYFQLFLTEKRQKKEQEAEEYRKKITQNYPQSKQAKLLANPNYIENFNKQRQEENLLYKETYEAYSKNNFRIVSQNIEIAKKKFPLSTLLPKFIFLDALSNGKMGLTQTMEQKLEELVLTYPDSDVSAMAKDLTALIKQGREAQTGTSHSSLLAKREIESAEAEAEKERSTQAFSLDKEGKHRLLFISPKEEKDLYQLMYEIASFNFTSFMIKEFDLQLSNINKSKNLLTLSNFDSYKEVLWYINSISKNSTLSKALSLAEVQNLIISDENYALAQKIGFDAYIDFQKNEKLSIWQAPKIQAEKTEQIAEKREQEKAQKPEKTINEPKKEILIDKTKNKTETAESVSSAKEEEKKEETAIKSPTEQTVSEATIEPEVKVEAEEELELYKGLFAYQPEKTHFVGIYILSGKIDFDKFKKELEAYNAENYNILNLEISLETLGRRSMILVGEFNDAEIAKSYLMRIVKEKEIFNTLRGANYRNILGTQRNINVLIKNDALNVYNSFMQEFYLK